MVQECHSQVCYIERPKGRRMILLKSQDWEDLAFILHSVTGLKMVLDRSLGLNLHKQLLIFSVFMFFF